MRCIPDLCIRFQRTSHPKDLVLILLILFYFISQHCMCQLVTTTGPISLYLSPIDEKESTEIPSMTAQTEVRGSKRYVQGHDTEKKKLPY